MSGDRLQSWLAGGLRVVMLPSGIVFALKIPDAEEMIAKGLIPGDLRAIATRFASSSIDPTTMQTDELAKLLRFMRGLVAHALRYVWNGPIEPIAAWQEFDADVEGWTPVTISIGMLEEGSVDGDDYAALQGIVNRQFSTAELTAHALRERKLIDAAEAERRVGDAEREATPGWQSFRGKRRRADAGASGGSVEGGARKPARRRRSDARVPAE